MKNFKSILFGIISALFVILLIAPFIGEAELNKFTTLQLYVYMFSILSSGLLMINLLKKLN